MIFTDHKMINRQITDKYYDKLKTQENDCTFLCFYVSDHFIPLSDNGSSMELKIS